MRKTMIFLLAWLAIYSCRPEYEMIKQNNDKTASKKFRVFSKDNSTAKGNNAIDYSKAFAYLAQRYDSLNHKNITGLVNSLNKVHYNKTLKQNYISKYSEAYLEFRLHSQTVFEKNGQIWVLYPKIDQNRVVDLVVAILSENETKVYFQTISRRSELFARSISTFQGNYDKYFRTDENGNLYFIAHTSRCGFEGEIPCEIPEIIISPPPKNGGGYTGELPGGGDNPPSGGGCEIYMECEPDGEETGGGSSSNNQQTNDPCAKAKTVGKNEKTKDLMSDLKTKTNSTKEIGYVLENKGGMINEHYIEGEAGKAGIEFSISGGKIDGYIHTHYTGLLSIFSPDDIFAIAQMYKQGLINDLQTFTAGVVTASGTQYLMVIDDPITFGEFANDLFNGSTFDKTSLNTYSYVYDVTFQIKTNNLSSINEKNFYKYISTAGTGLALLKGSNDMQNWGIVTKDPNGNIKIIDCN